MNLTALQSWATLAIAFGLVVAVLVAGHHANKPRQPRQYDDEDLNRIDRIERDRQLRHARSWDGLR